VNPSHPAPGARYRRFGAIVPDLDYTRTLLGTFDLPDVMRIAESGDEICSTDR
jgi:hypothetical protein